MCSSFTNMGFVMIGPPATRIALRGRIDADPCPSARAPSRRSGRPRRCLGPGGPTTLCPTWQRVDMDLPVMPPVAPMPAKLARSLPPAQGLLYEPKWDGFRCIAFRDGSEVELSSRNERPLTRYFPELVEPILRYFPPRAVVDGEIAIAGEHGLDFNALPQRIHPAASRVALLASSTPASFVGFDL